MTRLAPEDLTLAFAAALAIGVQLALAGHSAFLPVILVLTVLFGMPHGALDLALAQRLWPIRSVRRFTFFIALYLAIAGAVAVFWSASPTVALAAFLGYSAWHFSDDWRPGGDRAGGLAGGALVLAIPAFAEPERTAALFSALGAEGTGVVQGLGIAGIAAAAVFFNAALHSPPLLLRMAFLVVCGLFLSPLAFFFAFFCGLHSVRHMREAVGCLDLELRQGAAKMLWPTLGTFAILIAAGVLLATRGATFDKTIMQVVFVSFAALTVPHMLLVDRFNQDTRPKRGPERSSRHPSS